MNTGIYKIENTVNGKVYIGSTANFGSRFNGHKRGLRCNRHGNAHLQSSWNKYGESAFTFTPILYCDPEFLIKWEQIAIDGHKSLLGWDNMYNLRPAAFIVSSTTRKKQSASQKARFLKYGVSRETRDKMSKTRTGRTNSRESIEKTVAITRARGGYRPTNAFIYSGVGRKHSEETKARMRASHAKRKEQGIKLPPVSKSAREKMSKAKLGTKQSKET